MLICHSSRGRSPLPILPRPDCSLIPCQAGSSLVWLSWRPGAEGPDWRYELKRDGYCLANHAELNGVRTLTRGGLNSPRTLILDGEATDFYQQGCSSFNMQNSELFDRVVSEPRVKKEPLPAKTLLGSC